MSEQEEIKSIIEVREDFSIKIVFKAAYFLDPRELGRTLNDDNDRVAAMEFACEPAEKLSSCKMVNVNASKISEECALYSTKEGFFEKVFLWKNVSAIFPIAWWNGCCGCKEPTKIACKLLRLPATSAAMQRLFSCYSNVHTAKRNKLSNKRAARVVFVSQNIIWIVKVMLFAKGQFLTQHHQVHT